MGLSQNLGSAFGKMLRHLMRRTSEFVSERTTRNWCISFGRGVRLARCM
jgi:hypothetical protein